ncbi:hypothetical protein CTA1_13328 [Colletotrichum tanaceti]|uniref:Uncharacterized protein n=1 Tax=Colletotrichum tanaceti TaxID=1306861 RepID=A0A4U6XSZ5_9PEZI|nr:hypothetical protein CTA1_13328 [Colletotrichum tanaceti]
MCCCLGRRLLRHTLAPTTLLSQHKRLRLKLRLEHQVLKPKVKVVVPTGEIRVEPHHPPPASYPQQHA